MTEASSEPDDGGIVSQIVRQLTPDHPYTVAIIERLRGIGCVVERPQAQRQNYVNVRSRRSGRLQSPRLCTINRTTGRVEFQDGSFARAEQAGVAERFEFLAAGGKAALTPTSEADVDGVMRLAHAMLDQEARPMRS